MPIPREAYQALESVVGPEWVSEDPAICQGYCRGGWFFMTLDYPKGCMPPACVVLPSSTEEVQAIVRICNRYKIPFLPVGSGWVAFGSYPTKPDMLVIDMKRMKKMMIDEKNMYAIIEPGVTYGELHVEAWKRGLWYVTVGSGSQTRVLSNTHFAGLGPLGYRMGAAGDRRELAYEWVTPTGEIVQVGSASVVKEYFWGAGPGPDLRGMLREHLGAICGGFGIITKMAVKLFPFMPPSEAKFESYGISPTAYIRIPVHRVRWYNIRFPSYEKMVDAIYEICRAEIGAAIYTVPPIFLYQVSTGRVESRTDLREKFDKDREKFKRESFWMLRVLLVGYVSEEQLQYEERVLRDIAMEMGAVSFKEGSPRDHSWIISMDAPSVFNVSGIYNAHAFSFDSIRFTAKVLKDAAKIRDKYVPALYDSADYGWMHFYDYGHTSYGEFIVYFAAEDAPMDKAYGNALMDFVKYSIEAKNYLPRVPVTTPILGPLYQNYHVWLEKIKKAFDPNEVANPPKPLKYSGA